MVRRCEVIIAYMNLWPKEDGLWFVGMINTHPNYRNAGILRELIRGLSVLIDQHNIKILRSNVYHTNLRSLALHKKLGFRQTRKNEFGLELTLEINRIESILQRFSAA
jgi:ribosomal protein S18 acetylase RimI-like enzyme